MDKEYGVNKENLSPKTPLSFCVRSALHEAAPFMYTVMLFAV